MSRKTGLKKQTFLSSKAGVEFNLVTIEKLVEKNEYLSCISLGQDV